MPVTKASCRSEIQSTTFRFKRSAQALAWAIKRRTSSAMADPAQDVPTDGPLGQGDGSFRFRALGPGVPGAAGVGAVVELADQLDRPLQGVDAAIAVVADIHQVATGRAIPVQDVQLPEGEVRILGPSVGHRVALLAVARPSDVP